MMSCAYDTDQRARREHDRLLDCGMSGWTTTSASSRPSATRRVNTFRRARELLDATYRDSGCPNNDML
jgi:hypothetical protein